MKCLVDINITSSCSQIVNKKKDFPFPICLFVQISETAGPEVNDQLKMQSLKGFNVLSVTVLFVWAPKNGPKKSFSIIFSLNILHRN